MALEISGKLYKILPEQTGSGKNGNWVKQEFVIETQEQYPKKVCCSAWGDKVAILKNLSTGDQIKVSFNIESREYNERWYTDLRAWKIETQTSVGQSTPSPKAENDFQGDVSTFTSDSGEGDDLPF
ncbi:MAG TPA: DUF3127 domain-containing protein [Cytophagaceae bacterium]|jgi:hypothetical protein|nr:DUF3127 domain-containing protein [Cytophagaceae bacterium]